MPTLWSSNRIQEVLYGYQIFKLGTKYSESMNATAKDENGEAANQTYWMGCYGVVRWQEPLCRAIMLSRVTIYKCTGFGQCQLLNTHQSPTTPW